jgi:4-hydroxybenzoate polyprenyltransferase
MVFARSAAMGFNRVADRRIDAKNPRTASRHLPAAHLSVFAVCLFVLASAVGFIASTCLFLLREPSNKWPLVLSVPVLLFIAAYSYSKRFTVLAHFWLGASLMLAPVSTWIAIRGPTHLGTPLVLGFAVLFWVAGFDILYACQDEAFDRSEGLFSIPSRFGVRASLRTALLCHAVMLGWLILLYFVCPHLGSIYLAGLSAIAAVVAYEHWLVRPDDLARINMAFFQVNGVISVGLLGIVIVQLLAN